MVGVILGILILFDVKVAGLRDIFSSDSAGVDDKLIAIFMVEHGVMDERDDARLI